MGFPHFYVLVGLLLAMPAVSQFEVKYANVDHPITLTCSGESDRDVEWYFEQHLHSDRLLVAELHAGRISPGPDFEGRVESVSEEQPGTYSLVLNPVVYNDQGSYECRYKGSLHGDPLKDVKLVVIDGQMVYQLYNNTITYGPGFESRASVSPEQALHGNLFLTIRQARLSDQGTYLCFYGSPKETETPDSVRLHVTDHPPQILTDPPPQILTVKAGEELSIRLRTTDPVRVTFTGPGLDEVLMVDANEGPVTYGEHCGQRCEVLGQENTFLLRRVTPEDAGVYTVTDSETNRTISIVSLQISGIIEKLIVFLLTQGVASYWCSLIPLVL
ncbi:hypothetical protein COCON_G00018910 [Conger conger]|uniref:Ig-like domain-containing protein n=1 Tax=Conger conger TaxID=82655 RepID=A0A9Q1E419_CONCO|nr:hypothetical protein COCON_G00018910 [Conger conger]